MVMKSGKRYTTYVNFNPETYLLEQHEKRMQKQMEIAKLLVREYVPQVRAAVADLKDVYIPSGNRELFEAAAIFYAVSNKCYISLKTDLSQYHIKTMAGGDFIASVDIPVTQNDTDYVSSQVYPSYFACGDMIRWSVKYPSVYSWSNDTRYCSRKGTWENNITSDYEYLYEFMSGTIDDTQVHKEKFDRLREREFLTKDNKVNIMVIRGDQNAFFASLPSLNEEIRSTFAGYALEQATQSAKAYPHQMKDLIIASHVRSFIGSTVALMVMDLLYENGTFSPVTEKEKIASHLFMFCDVLPK